MLDISMSAKRIVWVDADGCPSKVVETCKRLSQSFDVVVITVANFHHEFSGDHHLTVSDESQAVDLAILNRLRKNDIVVTQDQGLAAMVLSRGGVSLSVSGHLYELEEISLLLEMRHAAARFRRAGGRTKGPKKRSAIEDRAFEERLTLLLKSE
ncbi:MAG: hypothetical protein JWN30_305 [Bacilli bacterium]|nr:hypothetical protein [Bacilli bacterium]